MSIVNPNVTAQILKNRGIPAKFHTLDQNPATKRWVRKEDEAREMVFETGYLQMTNSVLADIEDPFIGWGSLDAWQQALQDKPFMTLTATVALLRDWRMDDDRPDRRRAGAAMIDGGVTDYSVAVGTAFMIANGAPEDQVGKQLTNQLAEARKEQKVQWDKVFNDAESPGTLTSQSSGTRGELGPKPGASSDEDSTSSGDLPPHKSDS